MKTLTEFNKNSKDYHFELMNEILHWRQIYVRPLLPKNNRNWKMESYELFPLKKDYIQRPWNNFHFPVFIYKNNVIKIENLIWIPVLPFDVDVWPLKNCKTNEEFKTRLKLLNSNYWIKPHIIPKSTGWYHLYFILNEIVDYQKHKIVIDKLMEIINKELLWDEWFEWRLAMLKVIWSFDYSYKFNSPEKNVVLPFFVSNHKHYSLQFLYDLYNKITGNKRTIQHSEKIYEDKIERNNEFRCEINDQCPYIVTKMLWIYDKDNECIITYSKSLKRNISNRSIRIWYDKWLWKYCLQEKNWWKIDLFQVIINFFDWDYWKLLEFARTKLWIYPKNKDNYLKIPKIILTNIFYWSFQIDEIKMEREFWKDYKKIIEKTKILKNWRLHYKIIFLLLNILSHYDMDNEENIQLKSIKFANIFIKSYLHNDEKTRKIIHSKKIEYVKYFKIMKCLFTTIKDYKKDSKNDSYNNALISRIYLLNDFNENSSGFDIIILNWIHPKKLSHTLTKVPVYIPKTFLEYEEKLSWLLLLVLYKKLFNEGKISFSEVCDYIWINYNEKNIRDMKSEIKKKFWEIENYTKKYFSIKFNKTEVLLEK